LQDVSEVASNPVTESPSSPTGRKTEPAAIQGNNHPERRKVPKRKLLADMEERDKRNKLLEFACDHLCSMSDDVEILARSWAMDFRKLKPDQQGNLHKHTLTINKPYSCSMSSATPYSNPPSPHSSYSSSYSRHLSLNDQNYSLSRLINNLTTQQEEDHTALAGTFT
jgi:hypothetical protein